MQEIRIEQQQLTDKNTDMVSGRSLVRFRQAEETVVERFSTTRFGVTLVGSLASWITTTHHHALIHDPSNYSQITTNALPSLIFARWNVPTILYSNFLDFLLLSDFSPEYKIRPCQILVTFSSPTGIFDSNANIHAFLLASHFIPGTTSWLS